MVIYIYIYIYVCVCVCVSEIPDLLARSAAERIAVLEHHIARVRTPTVDQSFFLIVILCIAVLPPASARSTGAKGIFFLH